MTDTELRQLRQNLLQQFHQMMTDELPPAPEGYVFTDPDWSPEY